MFRAELERRRSVPVPGEVTFVFAQTSLRAASSFGGGGYAYRHPVAVRHEPSEVEIPIRDHVMRLRLMLVVLFVVAALVRSISDR
jgi:hypothetical protein